ncbi:unnamed protein product [Rotaria sp. Silwood1]|nr:unnamed protein product [Rotaria sp. Silwood1]CAF1097303.1 unnamed protein product [Rotaria sp. Silwood1]
MLKNFETFENLFYSTAKNSDINTPSNDIWNVAPTNFSTTDSASNTKQQCRFGSNCRQLSDSTHCDRFQHPSQTSSLNTVAPPDDQLSNMNADTSRSHASYRNDDTQKAYSIGDTMNSGRSNQQDQTTIKSSTSNTKQQCRFGSNCRQLSDSTHCDRFQHPSQTSSLNTVAPPDDQLSNMNADTSRSSRSHASNRNDDTQKAYSIGDTMNSGRSNQQDQTTIKSSSEDVVTVSLFIYRPVLNLLESWRKEEGI